MSKGFIDWRSLSIDWLSRFTSTGLSVFIAGLALLVCVQWYAERKIKTALEKAPSPATEEWKRKLEEQRRKFEAFEKESRKQLEADLKELYKGR